MFNSLLFRVSALVLILQMSRADLMLHVTDNCTCVNILVLVVLFFCKCFKSKTE